MPSIDMPHEQMQKYKPALYRENDFEDWDRTIAEALAQPLNPELVPPVDQVPDGHLQLPVG